MSVDTENSAQVLPCLNTNFNCFLSYIKGLEEVIHHVIEQNESFTYIVCEYWYWSHFFVTHKLSPRTNLSGTHSAVITCGLIHGWWKQQQCLRVSWWTNFSPWKSVELQELLPKDLRLRVFSVKEILRKLFHMDWEFAVAVLAYAVQAVVV